MVARRRYHRHVRGNLGVGGQADTRSRIVDVAARLLSEHGQAAVTTRGVAQAAGVQAPTIYRLFGDKDGLLDAVAEHVMATYVGEKQAAVDAASTENVDPLDDLRAGWSLQIEFGLANPTLFALLSVPGRGLQSPAARMGLEVLRSRVHRVAVAGRLRVSEQRAVGLIRAAGTGVVLTLLSSAEAERDSALADAMYETVLREILIEAVEPLFEAPIEAAIALRASAPELDLLSDGERGLLAEWLDRLISWR